MTQPGYFLSAEDFNELASISMQLDQFLSIITDQYTAHDCLAPPPTESPAKPQVPIEHIF